MLKSAPYWRINKKIVGKCYENLWNPYILFNPYNHSLQKLEFFSELESRENQRWFICAKVNICVYLFSKHLFLIKNSNIFWSWEFGKINVSLCERKKIWNIVRSNFEQKWKRKHFHFPTFYIPSILVLLRRKIDHKNYNFSRTW